MRVAAKTIPYAGIIRDMCWGRGADGRCFVAMYAVARSVPTMLDGAEWLGPVTVQQITQPLVWVVESPLKEIRILEPPRIRRVFDEPAIPR